MVDGIKADRRDVASVRRDRAGRNRGPRVSRGRSGRRQFLPPQHGAWAMLIVPFVAAVLVAGVDWAQVPLLGAWLVGYLLSYYVFLAVKTRRPRRYRDQLVIYGALTLSLLAVVVWARPAVLWYAPVYAVLLSINTWYAWRRRERALGNDLVAVVQSCLMVFVAATVAGAAASTVVGVFAVCVAYFAGTAFYVKTMIRERGNRSFLRWSIGYHAAVLVWSLWFGLWVSGFFAWLLIRSWVLPGRRLVPVQVGVIEIGNCLLLLGAIVYTW